MSPHHFLRTPDNPYSLIVDLLGETEPLGVTMGLQLGDIINRMDKEYICIGSGEMLGGIENFKVEEIRAYIVERENLNTVRNIFKNWVKSKSTLQINKEVTLKGFIKANPGEEPIFQDENNDTIISFRVFGVKFRFLIRFIKKNLRFIKGLNLLDVGSFEGVPIYIHGLAFIKDYQTWEILARSLITATLDYGIRKYQPK
ncbi:MAG: hypothetical protein ACFFCM_02035 [Promethearchaeota archaeon]